MARARSRFLGMVVAACCLAGCGERKAAERPVAAAEPIAVAVALPGGSGAGERRWLTGTVRARHEAVLSFKSAGRVAAVLVEEGDRVAAGRLLAALDATELAATTSVGRAEVTRADAEARRLHRLLDAGWVTKARVEEADAAQAVAAARLRSGEFDVRLARVRAPAAGVVLARHVEPGQVVAPGQPVVTMAEGRGGWVLSVPVTDTDLAGLAIGRTATVELPAVSPAPIGARVVELGGRADPRTGLFEAQLLLPGHPGLRSGLMGRAALGGGGAAGALTVPHDAVFDVRAEEGFVFVVDAAGHARLRRVEVAGFDDRVVRVARGLSPDDRVVRGGAGRLRDGAAVRVGDR